MRGMVACLVGFVLSQGPATAQVRDVNLGMSVPDGTRTEYYLALSDHYRVPPLHAVEMHERYRCRDEELPVVYFLAARARVSPSTIVGLRLQRMSWLDITLSASLTPDVFFVPVRTDPVGPPYGNAYGHYRKYAASGEWKGMPLTDQDVVALVNLAFLSEHHGLPPERVMAMRGREASFVAINHEIKEGKAGEGGGGKFTSTMK